MTRFAFHPRLWRKHLLQQHVYSALDLPELGLHGGETPAEEALWREAMRGAQISEAVRTEAKRQYDVAMAAETANRTSLRKRRDESGGPFRDSSKLAALFHASAEEAGVLGLPDFQAARDQLFWNTLIELGSYHELLGAELLRDVVRLFRNQELEHNADPTPAEGPLLRAGQATPPDVLFEIGGQARRALELYGSADLTTEALGRAGALGRFAIHLFKNYLRVVVGGEFEGLSPGALLARALELAHGVRAFDHELALRLGDLHAGRPIFPPEAEDVVLPMETERQLLAALYRLRQMSGALRQAWADGWLSPEERILLRYLFSHILGVGERTIGRFVNDKESALRLCAALQGLPNREGDPGYPGWLERKG